MEVDRKPSRIGYASACAQSIVAYVTRRGRLSRDNSAWGEGVTQRGRKVTWGRKEGLGVVRGPIAHCMHAKFEASSFSHSGDVRNITKIITESQTN